jgi:selenide,water dikinase
LQFPSSPQVLVGAETSDDAGVYQISPELALIQTVDFFTPMVDDPYDFGRIAAANALSDVYAMGGEPKTALNLVAFPMDLGKEALRAVLAGGIEKIKEAGAALLGGHSVQDEELKYGLAVTGFVHPDKVLSNQGLKPGDQLILTKPLGSGIISTAVKAGLASEKTIKRVTGLMAELNRSAAGVLADFPISACTDVTGFGLLGHLAEMVCGSRVRALLHSPQAPILPEALEFAAMGLVPAGAHANRRHREGMVELGPEVDPVMRDILYDPQTSGGLLIGCPAGRAPELLARLNDAGVGQAAVLGEVEAAELGRIKVF